MCIWAWKNRRAWYHLRQISALYLIPYTSAKLVGTWDDNASFISVLDTRFICSYLLHTRQNLPLGPIPVPGWYESAQYQNPTGMWKGTYQYNTGYNGLLMRFHCKIFCDTLSLTVSLYHRWKQLLFTRIQLFTYCGAFLFPSLFFFSFSSHRNLRLVRKDSMQPMYCLHNHLVLVDIKSHLAIGF